MNLFAKFCILGEDIPELEGKIFYFVHVCWCKSEIKLYVILQTQESMCSKMKVIHRVLLI